MIIAATGHRPPKLGGYTTQARVRLENFAFDCLRLLKPTQIISGMALGWDQAIAVAARGLGIPWIAAIPFDGQENRWPLQSKLAYRKLLAQAKKLHYVSSVYTPTCMQERNVWMVDHCDQVLALYNGSPGGTANCIAYANHIQRPVQNVWDLWVKEP